MKTHEIDLTAITVPQFEFIGSIAEDSNGKIYSAAEIAFLATIFAAVAAKQLTAFKGNDQHPATITLRRHYNSVLKACQGLAADIANYDQKHINTLTEAALMVRSAADNGPAFTLTVYDRLTRKFLLNDDQNFSDEFERAAPSPDFTKYNGLAVSPSEHVALNRYQAAAHSAPERLQ